MAAIKGQSDVLAALRGSGRDQAPFVMASGLTSMAKAVARVETGTIQRVFDRPTPFTMRAIGVTPATKQNLQAQVFVKDAQAKYLEAQVDGGRRHLKSFEERMTVTAGQLVVLPGDAAPRNAYGNISKAQLLKIIRESGPSSSGRRYFYGKPKGSNLPGGIYARAEQNRRIMPLLVFTQRAVYEKRFKFAEVAETVVRSEWTQHLAAAFERAMLSRR
ncbi:hypothetical protein ABIC71_000923 [Herbaspirillum seropedicae]|uniref:hypothetical protein n=1 Tax=Herbaspirillum seropedicae TaxID=964 RepID=UPI0033910848